MKIIGITGTSGAGKTTVCDIIEKNYNAKRIDADKIARELSKPGTEYFKEIVQYFGEEILQNVGGVPQSDLQIDRKKLADIIFYDDLKRKALNKITEKHVVKKINEKIEEFLKTDKLIVVDVPLLFESGLNMKCDETIGVIANETVKMQRICARDGIDEKLAKHRINALKDDEFLIKNCTHIITNEGDKEDIKEQIDLIFNEEIVYKNNGKFRCLQFKKLLEYPEINHAFVIKPLDFKNAEKDILIENYKPIIEDFNLNIEEIVKPYQTHTDKIYNVTKEHGIHIAELKDVDGLITDENRKVLSLVFADCLPIYLSCSVLGSYLGALLTISSAEARSSALKMFLRIFFSLISSLYKEYSICIRSTTGNSANSEYTLNVSSAPFLPAGNTIDSVSISDSISAIAQSLCAKLI